MKSDFEISLNELVDIANQMEKKVMRGLQADNQEIACLLTYVPVTRFPKKGRALVLDLGGTKGRAAVISLENGRFFIEERTQDEPIPWLQDENLTREKYLQYLFELSASLNPPNGLPLGYCFSYPTESVPDGDARLIKWTKEVFVPNTEGRLVGRMLLGYMRNNGLKCSKVSVINDTVACLLTGLFNQKSDGNIGLIVGTGINMATAIASHMAPKLAAANPDWKGPLPINLEAGNFAPPHLTRWDHKVDAASEDPGKQRFEKAVSGRYLGYVLKAAAPDCSIDPKSGSEEVVKLAYGDREADSPHVAVARQIIRRSAKLAAASLAGLIKVLNASGNQHEVSILAEGGLINYEPSGYARLTRTTLQLLLTELGMADTIVNFDYGVQDTNLKGSALAVLAG